MQKKTLLQHDGFKLYGSGFDEVPAPKLSKTVFSKKVSNLITTSMAGRLEKIQQAREEAALIELDLEMNLMPALPSEKHFKGLDDVL